MAESSDAAAQGGEAAKKKEPRTLEEVALRELRHARKLVKDGEPTPEASFVVSIANVYAILELASAIRSQGGDDGGAPEV